MKTLVKTLALVLSVAFVASTTSLANTNPGGRPKTVASYKTGIYSTVSGKLNIALDKENGGHVDIRLKSTDGRVLYAEHLGKNERSFRVRLNLNDLEDGTYQLEITNGVDVTTQNVTISTSKPSVTGRVVAMN